MAETTGRNKVHMADWGPFALCGADRNGNMGNVVPLSKEWRDVTCKNCLRKKPARNRKRESK